MVRKSFLALAVVAALTVFVFAAGVPKTGPVTVGDFAVKVAKALGYKAADEQAAVKSLKKSGVNLDASVLSSRLTEDKAAEIMRDLGVKVTSSNPSGEVSLSKAGALAAAAGMSAKASAAPVPATDLPTECLALRNRGQCDTCCTNYLVSIGIDPATTSVCAKFCSAVIPPGLASDPEPQP
jgi:hypothetical protein